MKLQYALTKSKFGIATVFVQQPIKVLKPPGFGHAESACNHAQGFFFFYGYGKW